jgi:PAS domain S-box-containing protein
MTEGTMATDDGRDRPRAGTQVDLHSIPWETTPLGDMQEWPSNLRCAAELVLSMTRPACIFWGESLALLFNETFGTFLGAARAEYQGRPAAGISSELVQAVLKQAVLVLNSLQPDDPRPIQLILERNGNLEEMHFNLVLSPVPVGSGRAGGVICILEEITGPVQEKRRAALLQRLATRLARAPSMEEALDAVSLTLEAHLSDFPFALLYADRKPAALLACAGVTPGSEVAPALIGEDVTTSWPIEEICRSSEPVFVRDLQRKFGSVAQGNWSHPPSVAVGIRIAARDEMEPMIFIAALSPFQPRTERLLDMLAEIAHLLGDVFGRLRRTEQLRSHAESLSDLDAAKSLFYANLSHQFRTPLTLILAPIADLLAQGDTGLPKEARNILEIVERNAEKLLRLVDNLLDLSRVETGNLAPVFEPVDLSVLTREIAEVFRAPVEAAGLRYSVSASETGSICVDREMWEKILLNLISNALKFTREGEIGVVLEKTDQSIRLVVRDTGIGIPESEIPKVFDPYQQAAEMGARTLEGSEVSLALVKALVGLHEGTVEVESRFGEGTAFVVTFPNNLPAAPSPSGVSDISLARRADSFVEEALRWLPQEEDELTSDEGDDLNGRVLGHVLVADDCADMRDYMRALLSPYYRVTTVPDGHEALAAAIELRPDLLLTDVAMPGLDGFGLLQALRGDSRTSTIPVIMLSGHAGEEERVEGLHAGADDYLIKPFSSRELLARVAGLLGLASIRRESEEALRESEERFRNLADNAPFMVWVTSADGVCTFLSKSWLDFTGQAAETALGRGWVKAVHPDDAAEWDRRFREARKLRQPFRMEYRLRRADGEYRWVINAASPRLAQDGHFLGYIGSVIDITEEKKKEEALRTSERLYRAIGESIDYGVWVCDPEGRNTYASESFLKLVGLTQEQCSNDGWLEVLHPDDRERTMSAWRECARTGGNWDIEHRFKGVDGAWHPILARGVPVRNATGEITAWAGINLDIGRLKDVENELREMDQRKDEFLAVLAHELRNPLAPLRNCVELIQMARNEPDEVDYALGVMERQLGQMVRLIDDLLDVSRISRGKIELKKEILDLNSVLRSAIETSKPLIKQGEHELTINLAREPVFIHADATRLAQIFANLLSNAAKYTSRGGHIHLSARREEGEALISVKDNGIGIPGHMLPKIFEMFTQVDRSLERSQSGLGIGLTIVRRLVEMHGGTVEAISQGFGKGSEFIVRLPKAENPVPESIAGRIRNMQGSVARRILVVDDNRDAALSLSMMLGMLGHEAETAHDGLEALKVAGRFRPDVILLDIGMPKLNGYDTCRAIRQQPWGGNTVIVAVTGWGQAEDRRKSQEAGFDYHLVKPVDPAAIEKLLGESGSKVS